MNTHIKIPEKQQRQAQKFDNANSVRKPQLQKITCILPQVTGGGAERFLITFLKHIDYSQYDVSVILAKRGGGFDHEIPQNVKIYVLTERAISTKLLAPTGPFRYVPELVNLLKDIQPDGIISFGSLLNGSVALAGKIAKLKKPIAVIEAIHESSEMSQHSGIEKWGRSLFLRWTYRFASAVVAVSHDIAVDLRENFHITDNVHVINYGISLDNIRKLADEPVDHEWLQYPRNYKVIVACGRFVKQKGFNVLIEAMSKLGSDIRLILVGDGEERKSLTTQIEHLNLQERISLVGYDRNPFRYIAKADAFVMPSLWEGLPIVLLEALSLGVPIIASDCPTGPREILNDGKCGVLVEPNNPDLLAEKIESLLSDEEFQKRISSHAIFRSQMFSAEACTQAYLNLLVQLSNC